MVSILPLHGFLFIISSSSEAKGCPETIYKYCLAFENASIRLFLLGSLISLALGTGIHGIMCRGVDGSISDINLANLSISSGSFIPGINNGDTVNLNP